MLFLRIQNKDVAIVLLIIWLIHVDTRVWIPVSLSFVCHSSRLEMPRRHTARGVDHSSPPFSGVEGGCNVTPTTRALMFWMLHKVNTQNEQDSRPKQSIVRNVIVLMLQLFFAVPVH